MFSFSVRFQDLIKERDEAKNMQDQNAFEKSKEYAGQWIIFYNACMLMKSSLHELYIL